MRRRSAIVTGASRGIGRGIAEDLVRQGFDVTVTARTKDRLLETADELNELGPGSVHPIAADLADRMEATRVVDAHRQAFGSLSTLILNAGVGSAGALDTYDLRRFDKMLEVNLRAPVEMIQSALPLLRSSAAEDPQRGARIIALSSITGVFAEPNLAAYGAAKAALISLVETLNLEESKNGVSATAIAPGFVRTDMAAWAEGHIDPTSMIPVQDIVAVAAMLAGLSAQSMISKIVVARSTSSGYCA